MNDIKILEWYSQNGVNEIISKTSARSLQDNSTNKAKDQIKTMNKSNIRLKENSATGMLPGDAVIEARNLANQCDTIEKLKDTVLNFDNCLLKKTATNTVFSDGNPEANIMLVGEAPGANEDLQGIPFCGDSGKLLDKILLSVDISREKNLYITNTIFWRPPGNRKPTEQELKCCLPFLEKHIALIKPKLLVLAGSTAVSALLGNLGAISKQRQKIFKYKNQYITEDLNTIVIFHPSYLLRQPSQKKSAWHDMLFIRQILS